MLACHTYAVDASGLLEECLGELDALLRTEFVVTRKQTKGIQCLYVMKDILLQTKQNIFCYIKELIYEEKSSIGIPTESQSSSNETSSADSLSDVTSFLKCLIDDRRERNRNDSRSGCTKHNMFSTHNTNGYSNLSCSFTPTNTTIDSLLFRLTVHLQLCLVRIDNARITLSGNILPSKIHHPSPMRNGTLLKRKKQDFYAYENIRWNPMLVWGTSFVTTYMSSSYWTRCLFHFHFGVKTGQPLSTTSTDLISTKERNFSTSSFSLGLLKLGATTLFVTQFGVTMFALQWLNEKCSSALIASKIWSSVKDIKYWNEQWVIQATKSTYHSTNDQPWKPENSVAYQTSGYKPSIQQANELVDYLFSNITTGDLRFQILKHVMDILYASVGTAVDFTGGGTSDTAKTMVAAIAASVYYSLTGSASKRSAEVTNSSRLTRELIQHAWGIVSLPSLKQLSLNATCLIKGSAVADRIDIAGVSCFVLSTSPVPELATAIAQAKHRRQVTSNLLIQRLSTIDESEYETDEEHDHDVSMELLPRPPSSFSTTTYVKNNKPFARCARSSRQRDVILHLTGGGFFTHLIASDLPYLLDWSTATDAVIICPEYALLPEYSFPVALNQVEKVYRTLTDAKTNVEVNVLDSCEAINDSSDNLLGFDVNKIIVTGESAGGNLAAALCARIGTYNIITNSFGCDASIINTDESSQENRHTERPHTIISSRDENLASNGSNRRNDESKIYPSINSSCRMPDALMLSCPILNLSLEISHPSIIRSGDPVLSAGLISAISEAYVPSNQQPLGNHAKNPLISPLFLSDEVLRQFPTTLLFASSTDPVLDDSVHFNSRLRNVGVLTELFVAHNVPHAFWGLGMAGFPEAKQVQEHCIMWLTYQINRDAYH